MKPCFLLLPAILVLTAANAPAAEPALAYPQTEKIDHADVYHGTRVSDPYRWLEDANSPKTQAWVEAQNEVTFGFLRQIPARENIRRRVESLWNYERFTTPSKEGGRYFFSKNTGLQNQNVLFFAPSVEDAAAGRATLLLDPNTLSPDGTVSLASVSMSEDGRRMAYGVQTSGSDWIEWRVKDVETQRDLPDVVKNSKFSGAAWTKDGGGFFYSAYDAPDEKTKLQSTNYFQKLYFHKLGTPQGEDVLAYERKDQKEWGFGGDVTDDGKFLVITVTQGTDPKTRVYYRPLDGGPAGAPVVELLNNFDARYHFVGNEGTTFYFLTNKDATRARLVAVDTAKPGAAPVLREIIPQASETLQSVNFIGGRFVANYLKDAHTVVRVFETNGRPAGEVPFPTLGTAAGFSGRPGDAETFYSFTSYTQPTTIYRYDVRTGDNRPVFTPKVSFNPADFITEQVFFLSKDNTRVPMFLTYKKGRVRDGKNPTLLYGYGGFDISLTPAFSPQTSSGWKWAASMPWRTCAAAASTVRNGTRPAPRNASKTCSTTLSARRNTSSRTGSPPRRNWPSPAVPTAGCSSARRSPSGRTCSARRCPRWA